VTLPPSSRKSQRALRNAKLLARAEVVLGDKQAALEWLKNPKRRFRGRSPIEMLDSVEGRLVEEILVQIDEGMFA